MEPVDGFSTVFVNYPLNLFIDNQLSTNIDFFSRAEEKRKNDLFTDLGQSIKWRGGEEEGTSEEKEKVGYMNI